MAEQNILLNRWRIQSTIAAPLSARLARHQVFGKLRHLTAGRLTIVDAQGAEDFGPNDAELRAVLRVTDDSFYTDVVLGGTLGVGESYVDAKWTCNDSYALFRMFSRDRQALAAMDGGAAKWIAPVLTAAEWFRRNTRENSRRNILAHYDLGNAFYNYMLDPTMMYSCAVFGHADEPLEAASIRKLDGICLKLGLKPGMRVVEIGSGWGSFAIHAASKYGCHVTTTTISDAQYNAASARIQQLGLQDRITLLKQDYRDLTGSYDRLVSIEMIEAVGHQYFDTYFAKCQSLLQASGAMLIQAIVINDDVYESHLNSVDFIQKYVFPGSTIPAIGVLLGAAGRTGDMRLTNLEDITRHYAPTLLGWRQNFWQHIEAIRGLGFDERFIRLWDFYLAYCAAGFAERYLGAVQLLWAKQRAELPVLNVAVA